MKSKRKSVVLKVLFLCISLLGMCMAGCSEDDDVSENGAGSSPVKIMPLGDSITYVESGYRGYLHTKLTESGYSVDFVGNSSDMPDGGTDPDHEGHSGAVVGPGATYYDSEDWTGWSSPNNLYDHVDEFMKNDPDIILLMIGINEYTNYSDPSYNANASAPAKLQNLLNKIFEAKPEVTIFVSSLLAVSDVKSSDYPMSVYNAALPDIVTSLQSSGKNIFFVDMNTESELNPNDETQLYDGLHPDTVGGQKIADVWYNHLVSEQVL